MATTDDTPMSKREATYRRGRPKFPVQLYWTRDGNDEAPTCNIQNPDEDEAAQAMYDEMGVESFEELAKEVFGTTDQMPMGMSEKQIGVLVGEGDDAEFFTDRELLGFVDGLSDELADGLIDWFDDIPSMCEKIRRGNFAEVAMDADVEGYDWADELRGIDDMERRMKSAKIWQEPENVTAGDW